MTPLPRIAILTTSFDLVASGGVARYSMELAKALKGKGLALTVFIEGGRGDKPFWYEGIEVRSGLIAKHRTTLLNLFSILSDYWWLRRQVAEFDLIHAFAEHHVFAASMLGKPYFVTAHGTYTTRFLTHGLYRLFSKTVFARACAIVCVSAFTEQKIRATLPSLANTRCISNGVALPKSSSQPARSQNLIMSVGGLKFRKGFHLVIEALPLIAVNVPDVEYVIAGDPSNMAYLDSMKKRAQELGVASRVRFLGVISEDELQHLYKSTRLFVLTPVSRESSFEGFGLVYLEANAHGTPVVGMKGSGAEDAIKEGESGFMARAGDIEDLAHKVTALMTDDELWDLLSNGSLQWASEHSWDRVADAYAALYEERGAAGYTEAKGSLSP